MGDLLWNIALVFAFVLIGGVFAATEMALVTLRESQINAIGQRGRRGAKVAALARNPNTFLSAVQIGVTVAGFASAAYGATSIAPSLAPVLESWGLAPALALTVATLVLTLVIAYLSLVLGELVPKRLAIQRNAQFAYAVAPALNGFATVMRPVIWLLSVSTNALVRLLGGDPHKTSDEMTDEEVRDIVASHQGLPDDERRILDDVLSLRGRQVSEVMRPRPEVVALDEAASVGEVMAQVRDLPFSRYPVSETSIDDITGFVHVRDLFEAASDDPTRPLSALMRDIPYIPSTARVLPTLTRMRAEGHHIAVVIDEYGGTDGLVSIEDLIEIVVGDIEDEHDLEETPIVPAGENRFTADARATLAELKAATGVDLSGNEVADDIDTLGGLIVTLAGRVPAVGETVKGPEGLSFEILDADQRRVKRLTIHCHSEPATEEPAMESG